MDICFLECAMSESSSSCHCADAISNAFGAHSYPHSSKHTTPHRTLTPPVTCSSTPPSTPLPPPAGAALPGKDQRWRPASGWQRSRDGGWLQVCWKLMQLGRSSWNSPLSSTCNACARCWQRIPSAPAALPATSPRQELSSIGSALGCLSLFLALDCVYNTEHVPTAKACVRAHMVHDRQ
jgi:hypothetical protein